MLWNNKTGKWESPEDKKKNEAAIALEKEKAANKPVVEPALKPIETKPQQQPQSKQVK